MPYTDTIWSELCRTSVRILSYVNARRYVAIRKSAFLPEWTTNTRRFSTNQPPPVHRKTAAAVIIGDEILNGITLDTNTQVLAKFLFSLGIEFKKVEIVPDQEEPIVDSVRRLSSMFDYVFTSGGVGPTHDDVTYESIAKAFDLECDFHEPTLEKMKLHYASRMEELNESRKRMAYFPEGSQVHYASKTRWTPIVQVKNVYILPGIPQLFKELLEEGEYLFKDSKMPPKHRVIVYTNFAEGDIAEFLRNTQAKYTDVKIGSYPTMEPQKEGYSVKITLEGDNLERIEEVARNIQRQYAGFRELKKPSSTPKVT
jgi:molybdenum cofactor synthesis domain-containing protein